MLSDEELLRIHADALAFMTAGIDGIDEDAWDRQSPCDAWSVRDVVNHITAENLWAKPLMEGSTVDDIGDRFDGDVLGGDPKSAWRSAGDEAGAAFGEPDATKRTVNVSWGDIPSRSYLEQMTSDLIIHAWDVLAGSGQRDEMPQSLVDAGIELVEPAVKSGVTSSVFKPPVDISDRADGQTRLLALTGRDRSHPVS
jgi:uncharacterized protein (TIGR03086 family)